MFNLQKYEEHQLIKYNHIFAKNYGKWHLCATTRLLVIPKIKNEFIMKFCLSFLGGLLIINGHLTITSLLIFEKYYNQLMESIKLVSQQDADLQSNRASSCLLYTSRTCQREILFLILV